QTPNNVSLSPLDKVLINMIYPKTGVTNPNEQVLTVGDPPTAGTIGTAGQVASYRFTPQASAIHLIEVQGNTRLLVALLSERGQPASRMLAFEGSNTQFSFLPTSAGPYFLEVRHAKPMVGTGPFTIAVKQQS